MSLMSLVTEEKEREVERGGPLLLPEEFFALFFLEVRFSEGS
jgi:hypothetical protein